MTQSEWMKAYDETNDKFMWFIEKHYPQSAQEIRDARKEGKYSRMFDLLNMVWFNLPDNQYNIMENPPGWTEFLNLLENPVDIVLDICPN